MRVLFIRHAEAEPGSETTSDAGRRLTANGRDVSEHIGAGLRAMKISIDRIWSSPLARARETATLLAHGYGWRGTVEETDALGYNCTVHRVHTALAGGPVGGTVVCVGHEPDMGVLSARFLEERGDLRMPFAKAAVCGIEFDGLPECGQGTLLFFYRAEHFLRLR